jgi:hypothetical protein
MDLTDFLAARLDEKEAAAPEFHEAGVCAGCNDWDAGFDPGQCDCGYPARVLREVAAVRAVLDAYQRSVRGLGEGLSVAYRRLVQAAAAVYSDHPDYDPAWAPAAS